MTLCTVPPHDDGTSCTSSVCIVIIYVVCWSVACLHTLRSCRQTEVDVNQRSRTAHTLLACIKVPSCAANTAGTYLLPSARTTDHNRNVTAVQVTRWLTCKTKPRHSSAFAVADWYQFFLSWFFVNPPENSTVDSPPRHRGPVCQLVLMRCFKWLVVSVLRGVTPCRRRFFWKVSRFVPGYAVSRKSSV